MRREEERIERFYDDNGKELKIGDTVTYLSSGRQFVGKFLGFSKGGMIQFECGIGSKSFTYSAKEIGITDLCKCDLEVGGLIG